MPDAACDYARPATGSTMCGQRLAGDSNEGKMGRDLVVGKRRYGRGSVPEMDKATLIFFFRAGGCGGVW
jgi:hypothetical protein